MGPKAVRDLSVVSLLLTRPYSRTVTARKGQLTAAVSTQKSGPGNILYPGAADTIQPPSARLLTSCFCVPVNPLDLPDHLLLRKTLMPSTLTLLSLAPEESGAF